jgi:HSP20 family molecular chaperone IbpA
MNRGYPRDWMWSEALQMLAQAERLHQQVFKPAAPAQQRTVNWEPPVDVLETEDALLILAALPGVDPDKIRVAIHDGVLVIAGERLLPDELKRAVIHRLELPQGNFERRIQLPAGRYDAVRSVSANGCLVVRLAKVTARKAGL